MNSKDLIKPVEFIGVGQCYFCTTPLVVYENELTSLVLDKNGLPINHEVEYCNVVGICPNCKKIFPMERRGMHYKMTDIFKSVSYDTEKKEKANESIEDNPFINKGEQK